MFSHSAPATVDAVVVGAGLVGACCGYELAVRGRSVLIVDRGAVAAGGTGTGLGAVAVGHQPGPLLDLARHSRQRWDGLADRLAADLDHRPDLGLTADGAVSVARGTAAAKQLSTLAAEQRAAGLAVEQLSDADLAALAPGLADDVTSAVRYPGHARVTPVAAALAVLAAAVERGAVVVPAAPVAAIEPAGTGMRVDTAAGTVSTGTLVLTAGAWTAPLADLASVRLPLRPGRGHLLVTEPLPQPPGQTVYESGTDAAPLVLAPTGTGALAIATTGTEAGFETAVSVPVLRRLAADAVRLMPALRAVAAVRGAGTLFGRTPDELPIIGADPQHPGLWYATGHGAAGVGLAPATGELLADLVTGATPSLDPAPYAPGRPGLAVAEPEADR
ncbi:FAD-binding oxidoreductase [Actinocatenispora sera]|uniref:NAD(P)/FAD-dependent oxidoreductase n=1 Tax=Actinocatenispora sera TaxID=390989 RepID=UPI0034011D2C